MGSHNKGIRKLMEKLYGSKCMVEEAGIRYIPVEERKNIKRLRNLLKRKIHLQRQLSNQRKKMFLLGLIRN